MTHPIIRYCYFLLITMVLAACSTAPTSPEKISEKYVNAIYQNDIETVMALIDLPDDADQSGSKDMLQGKLKMMVAETQKSAKEKGGVKAIHAETARYYGEKTADVTVTISFHHAEDITKNIKLVQTDNGWKIRF